MRRAEVLRHPFPPEWREILARNVPAVAKLDATERTTLEDKVRIFLAEKNLEGCAGLELTDEMRVTVAAHACLLLLHLEGDAVFPTVESVLVYPSAYKAPQARGAGGIVVEDQGRLGESHARGAVVLAWDAVKRAAHGGPKNLVLHEFAHALDQEDGLADGTPVLSEIAMYRPWARVLGAEYEHLAAAMHAGHQTSLDPYGATNSAEFFAVATEAFFGRPAELQREHPALYEQLRGFYRQDPASRA
jgi:Mlc titration factor MtfA (ptsG expression regulator)